MSLRNHSLRNRSQVGLVALFTLAAGHIALGQAPASPGSTTAAPARPAAQDRSAIASASSAQRDRELKLLGITAMHPGATAYDIGKPGNANYDESKANPYPKLPPLLVMKDGTAVKTAAQWKKRRAEIQVLFCLFFSSVVAVVL